MNTTEIIIINMMAGMLATMNVWINKPSDIRFNINDFYMAGLMTSFMIIIMGIYYKIWNYFIWGSIASVIFIVLLRKQVFVSEKQYIDTMIPHHAMAIEISEELLKKNPSEDIKQLAQQIIKNQEKELNFMKSKNG